MIKEITSKLETNWKKIFKEKGLNKELRFDFKKGRVPEEFNIDIYKQQNFLLSVKFFSGRKPYYKKWIEFFNISKNFFNTPFEKVFIYIISKELKGGEKFFIEYINDEKTYKALSIGIPVHLTRLGYILLNHQFFWFKDLYFPEGYREGLQKILTEKPLNKEHQKKQIENLRKETERFIEKYKNTKDELYLEAIKYSKTLDSLRPKKDL